MADLQPINLPEPDANGNFSMIDPLDSRYYDPEIARHLSESSRIAYQAHLEAALAQTLAEFEVTSQDVADEVASAAAQVTAKEVYEAEKTTKHDIKALVNVIKSKVSDNAKPYVHFGATSNDIISSASTLQLQQATRQIVIPRLNALVATLVNLAGRYADTVQVGRTHGQHAVPITFGFALSEYVSRLGTTTRALHDLSQELHGKFSGAVGAYNALSVFVDDPLKFEAAVLQKVGLKPAPYSTQIVPPENTVRLIDELAIAAGIMANLGHDMRHLQRSEIAEIREKFEPGQTGSSTMAHKRNPWNFEHIVSMAKQVTAQTVNANLNLSSEHQRDLTDSASVRFYPLVLAIVASMAARLDKVMSRIEVDEEAMKRNLALSGGAIAAEPLYLLFAKYGHTAAHEQSKELAHRALAEGKTLVELIEATTNTKQYWDRFTEKERNIITDPATYYTGLAAQKARQIIDQWKQN